MKYTQVFYIQHVDLFLFKCNYAPIRVDVFIIFFLVRELLYFMLLYCF